MDMNTKSLSYNCRLCKLGFHTKSRSHLEILGVKKVTCSKLHIKDPKILSITEQNLVTQDLHILANKVCKL